MTDPVLIWMRRVSKALHKHPPTLKVVQDHTGGYACVVRAPELQALLDNPPRHVTKDKTMKIKVVDHCVRLETVTPGNVFHYDEQYFICGRTSINNKDAITCWSLSGHGTRDLSATVFVVQYKSELTILGEGADE